MNTAKIEVNVIKMILRICTTKFATTLNPIPAAIKNVQGVNPTIVSYNASAVKIYNATISLVRLENKNILLYFEKRFSLLQRLRWSCKFQSRRIGSWQF
jgi:hypothetical protein